MREKVWLWGEKKARGKNTVRREEAYVHTYIHAYFVVTVSVCVGRVEPLVITDYNLVSLKHRCNPEVSSLNMRKEERN